MPSYLKPKHFAEMYQFHWLWDESVLQAVLYFTEIVGFILLHLGCNSLPPPNCGNPHLIRFFLPSLAPTTERPLPSAWHHRHEEGLCECQLYKKQMMHPLGMHDVLVFKFLFHQKREEWFYHRVFRFILASSLTLFLDEPWEYKKVVFQQVNHLISAGKSPAAVSLWEVLSHLFN